MSTLPARKSATTPFSSVLRREPRDALDADREVPEAVVEARPVLLREDRRGHEHEHLTAARDHLHGGSDGHLRLAEAHVAADQPVHRPRRLEVRLDGLDRLQLVVRLRVGERLLQLAEELVVRRVLHAGSRVPRRVEGDQLARHLVHGMAGPRLERHPGLAAELRQGGRSGVGADVARHLGDLLVRQVEPVLALELQVEVVPGDARHRLRLEADEAPDAVVLVDDVVPAAQVHERRHGAPQAPLAGGRSAPSQELHRGDDRQAQRLGHHASADARDDEGHPRRVREPLAGFEDAGLDPAQSALRAVGVTAVGEGHEHAQALADEPAEGILRLGRATGGERRTLSLERERLPERQGLEGGHALDELHHVGFAQVAAPPHGRRQGELGDALPTGGHHPLRLPGHDGACTDELRHEGGQPLGDARLLLAVVVDEQPGGRPVVGELLARRLQHGVVELAQRALGQAREHRHALHLVAEQLDADGLAAGGREHVQHVAADGQLAALLDTPPDALVPHLDQGSHELVALDDLSVVDAHRPGPPAPVREPLDPARPPTR
jgi:hypothetical protein